MLHLGRAQDRVGPMSWSIESTPSRGSPRCREWRPTAPGHKEPGRTWTRCSSGRSVAARWRQYTGAAGTSGPCRRPRKLSRTGGLSRRSCPSGGGHGRGRDQRSASAPERRGPPLDMFPANLFRLQRSHGAGNAATRRRFRIGASRRQSCFVSTHEPVMDLRRRHTGPGEP